jgi:hypothetical protein
MMMVTAATDLSPEDADRFRSFERQRHDKLAATYHDFFTPVTALAIKPLLGAVRLRADTDLLDVATGPGSLAAEVFKLGARPICSCPEHPCPCCGSCMRIIEIFFAGQQPKHRPTSLPPKIRIDTS